MTEGLLDTGLSGFSVMEEGPEMDLKSKFGFEDTEEAEFHIYKYEKNKPFGTGPLVGKLRYEELNSPADLAHFGPGEYLIRPYNKKYLSGSMRVEIAESMAREAGWVPDDERAKIAQDSGFELLRDEVNQLRGELQRKEQEKDNLMSTLLTIATKDNGNLDKFILMQQQAQENFNRMMTQLAEQRAQALEMQMQLHARAQEAQARLIEAMLSRDQGNSIADIMAIISPLIAKGKGDIEIAQSMVDMFRTGLQTGQSIESGPTTWMDMLKQSLPLLLLGGKENILTRLLSNPPPAGPQPQPAPQPPPQLPPDLPEPRQPQQPKAEQAAAENTTETQKTDDPQSFEELMERIENGDKDALKKVFIDYCRLGLARKMTPEGAYEMVTSLLPRGIHEILGETDLQFAQNEDGISGIILKTIHDKIKAEYADG